MLAVKSDKNFQNNALLWINNINSINRNITNQSHILLTGIFTVRHKNKNPIIWKILFKAVNLDPTCMPYLRYWCKLIDNSMQADYYFYLVTANGNID